MKVSLAIFIYYSKIATRYNKEYDIRELRILNNSIKHFLLYMHHLGTKCFFTGIPSYVMIYLYEGEPSGTPFFQCAGHGTILAGESPVTGIYRQV